MPISALAFLILTAAIALLWSHYQLLWADEFGVITTASIPSITQLIHIELTKPFSWDPIGYNALMHTVSRLFGLSAFAMRLPSMGGYLLMQVCLFYFVRRIATERAATVALAFPALVGIVSYSAQARPYGLLLGLSTLVMLSWQTATRRSSRRTLALVVLPLSMAMVINTQYYGVLLLVPLFAAESIRIFERRRADIPVLVSIFACVAGLAIAEPFARALSRFSAYHQPAEVSYHFISHSYLWLMMGNLTLNARMQHVVGFSIVGVLLALVGEFVRLRSKVTLNLPHAEATFVVILLAFPVLAYLLAKYVTYFVESRYVQPAIIGIAAISCHPDGAPP
jgi:hypothetical protein